MKVGDSFGFDDPANACFGCSPHNRRGLKLRFVRTESHSVESRYTVDAGFAGAPGIVHGGVQAALLDEVMGVAAQAAFDGGEVDLVTVDLRLRYRRPVRVGEPLTIRASLLRHEKRDVFVEGAILDESGEVLTRGESRWRRIDR